jgi:hypothetical protein
MQDFHGIKSEPKNQQKDYPQPKKPKSNVHAERERERMRVKSSPVRNAGAVPFIWEKIPGKPN